MHRSEPHFIMRVKIKVRKKVGIDCFAEFWSGKWLLLIEYMTRFRDVLRKWINNLQFSYFKIYIIKILLTYHLSLLNGSTPGGRLGNLTLIPGIHEPFATK